MRLAPDRTRQHSALRVLVALTATPALGACASSTSGGGDGARAPDGALIGGGDGGTTGMDGSGGNWDVPGDGPVVVGMGMTVHDPDGGAWTCYVTTCASHLLQCGDCTDNDGDGLIDSHDPDCLGPCSNSEANLFGSVGGGTAAACNLNCYFNFGQGMGSGCSWDHECDPLTPVANCPYVAPAMRNPGLAMRCPQRQTTECHNVCEPLTPNGCDCFGCCQFGSQFLYLGTRDASGNPTCTIETARAGNTTACHPCTPVRDPTTMEFSCGNGCGRCEYCIDGHVPEASCFTSTPDAGPTGDGGTTTVPDGGTNTMQCSAGIQPCGAPGQAPCPFGYYCITGCCQAAPP